MPPASSEGVASAARRLLGMIGFGPSKADALYEQGAELMEVGRYPEAIAALSKALEIAPDDVDALERRATAFMMIDDYDRAIADLERAATLDPRAPDVLASLCSVYSERDPERAVRHGTASLGLEPDDGPTLNNRSTALRWLGRDAEAAADLDRAIDLMPDEPTFRCNRAIDRIEDGDFAGAAADLDEAGAAWPNDPTVMLAAARIALARGDLKEARDFTGSVLAHRPGHPEGACMDALIALREGRADAALEGFDRLIENPSAGPRLTPRVRWMALYGRGLARRSLGDVGGAEADLTAARAIKPSADRIAAAWGLAEPAG